MRLASVPRLLSGPLCLLIVFLFSAFANAATIARDTAAVEAVQSENVNVSIAAASGTTVSSKVLVIARDRNASFAGTSGFQGYGIPYEVLLVPSSGAKLPTLYTSNTQGNYGGIVIIGDVTYSYSTGWRSALTDPQWQQLFDYQTAFNVRMVRLDVYPGAEYGTENVGDAKGCCNAPAEQSMSITNNTGFEFSGMRLNANVTTKLLWHYPAKINKPNSTWEVAKFSKGGTFTTDTTAAVVNVFPNGSGSRQQMAWFIGWATDWNMASNYMQHAWINWVVRGTYTGWRRTLFSTQIDDVHLETEIYASTTFEPKEVAFRVRTEDLEGHVTWTTSINKKMNTGSNYFIELGHNGNGNIEASVEYEDAEFFGGTGGVCSPNTGVEYVQIEGTPQSLEYAKPMGTGEDLWPSAPKNYTWSLDCALQDELLSWFYETANLNAYAHVSHTFTHENLMNATYSDSWKELAFNNAWMTQVGIDKASRFSKNGLIPPAITGLHNGDTVKAFLDNGVKYVVGDNTRPALMNTDSGFWPLTSTVQDNGYAGLEIIPRWATTIYYNCDTPECTLAEWKATSAGQGTFTDLLEDAKNVNLRHLFGLKHDPFMFHQANLRYSDMTSITINGSRSKRSLLMMWVEVIVTEFTRLVTWPIITLKHDDFALDFMNRRTRDKCRPNLSWVFAPDGKSITGATLTANGNTCAADIPVTFPGPVVSTNGFRTEQLGSDPLTIWVKLNGKAVTFNLKTPLPV